MRVHTPPRELPTLCTWCILQGGARGCAAFPPCEIRHVYPVGVSYREGRQRTRGWWPPLSVHMHRVAVCRKGGGTRSAAGTTDRP